MAIKLHKDPMWGSKYPYHLDYMKGILVKQNIKITDIYIKIIRIQNKNISKNNDHWAFRGNTWTFRREI